MTKKQRLILLSIETFFIVLNAGVYFTQTDAIYKTMALIFGVAFALFFIIDWHAWLDK
jgi:hypothetical protein